MKITGDCKSFSLAQLSSLLNPYFPYNCSWLEGSGRGAPHSPLRGSWIQAGNHPPPPPQATNSDDSACEPSVVLIWPSSPSFWPFWPSATPKTHPYKEGHSREIMCVGWPWLGGNCRPFCSMGGGGSNQINRDPLSDHWPVLGAYASSPLPPIPSPTPQSQISHLSMQYQWFTSWNSALEPSGESQM